MSISNPISTFDLVQALAQEMRGDLVGRLKLCGYANIGMSDIRLIWHASTGGHNVQRLAALTGTTKQFCAREVQKLRAAGLLRTDSDKQDGRALKIRLTANGERLLADVQREKAALERSLELRTGTELYGALQIALRALTTNPHK